MQRIREKFEFIKTRSDLSNITNRLRRSEPMQWRLPAITSNDGKWSAIIIVPHQKLNYTLHVPYYLDRYTEKEFSEETRTVDELASDGLKKEAGIEPTKIIILESYTVKDSSGKREDHIKYVVLVTEYVETDLQLRKEGRTGNPWWVSDHLLRKDIYFSNHPGDPKPHPQRKTYTLYMNVKECYV